MAGQGAAFLARAVLPALARPIARIVHVGAGSGGDLPAYLETGAAEILMIEADADAAAELAARAATLAHVRTMRAALSADPAPRPFYRMNFPDLNSLSAPTALLELFPGLKIVSKNPAAPADPRTALAPPDTPEGEGSALLVLETPGEALGILNALTDAGRLRGFDAIALSDGREPLYEGAAPLAEIEAALEAAGYDTRPEDAPEEPERPWLAAWRAPEKPAEAETATPAEDIAAAELAAAEAAREAALSARAEAEAARAAAEDRLHRLRDEMLKAEGQIALIRELLLPGSGR